MLQNQELERRRSQVAHVQATNALSGVCVSRYLASKIDAYAQGRMGSEELVAAVKSRYGVLP